MDDFYETINNRCDASIYYRCVKCYVVEEKQYITASGKLMYRDLRLPGRLPVQEFSDKLMAMSEEELDKITKKYY